MVGPRAAPRRPAPYGRRGARPSSARRRSCRRPRAAPATAASSAFGSRMICTALWASDRGWEAGLVAARATDRSSDARGAIAASAAFHHLRQREGRHRQVDHRGAQRRRAGRAGRARSPRSISTPASARSAAISTTAPRRSGGSASSCRCRPTRPSIPARARASTRLLDAARATAPSSSSSTRRAATIRMRRAAMVRADTLVTPINDSFVDLDLIGEVDAETYRVRRPSFYAELVWNSRTQRAKTHGASVDWVVLRNRMQHIEARNMRRVGEALTELSRRVGFRDHPGPRRARHLSRALPQGPDPARPAARSATSALATSPRGRNCAR